MLLSRLAHPISESQRVSQVFGVPRRNEHKKPGRIVSEFRDTSANREWAALA